MPNALIVLRRLSLALASALLLAISGVAAADIYRYVDDQGVVHITNRYHGPGYQILVRTGPRLRPLNIRPGRRSDFEGVVDKAAMQHGVNQELLHAVILHESAYDKRAISKAGAMGLMQLMPDTAAGLGIEDPWDPTENVSGGARLLRELLERYQSLELALAAYNAGEASVERYGRQVPPFPETQQYVRKVIDSFRANLALAKAAGATD